MGNKNFIFTICLAAFVIFGFTASVQADNSGTATITASDPVAEFAQRRLNDLKKLIKGPNGQPAPHIEPFQTCQQLYYRRLEILPRTLNYKPDYWDDPRNRVAVFLGTMFAPAFYFLGYTGVSAYLDAANQIDPRIELDALRHASAQQRCFLR